MKLDAEVFLDAAYLIALGVPADQHHSRALELFQAVKEERIRIVTNRAVLLEVGSALCKTRFRPSAIRLLDKMQNSPIVEIVPVTEQLSRAGWELFCRRPDKEWSWADCISFVVMRERGIRQALTTDEHFEQAGFVALLR
jgi:Predicted nucleic acid-binding protein, contains PIN domain